MDTHRPQEVVLEDEKVQEDAVGIPRDTAYNGAGDGIEDEMVRGCDNGGQDDRGVGHAQAHDGETLPRGRSQAGDGERRDCQSDKKGVSEMERWHGG